MVYDFAPDDGGNCKKRPEQKQKFIVLHTLGNVVVDKCHEKDEKCGNQSTGGGSAYDVEARFCAAMIVNT